LRTTVNPEYAGGGGELRCVGVDRRCVGAPCDDEADVADEEGVDGTGEVGRTAELVADVVGRPGTALAEQPASTAAPTTRTSSGERRTVPRSHAGR
jgi:hypothetical protein